MRFAPSAVLALVLLLASTSLPAQSIQEVLENKDGNIFAGMGSVVIRPLDSNYIVVGFDDASNGNVDRIFTITISRREKIEAVKMIDARLASWDGHLLMLFPAEKRAYLFESSDSLSSYSDDQKLALGNRYSIIWVDHAIAVYAKWGTPLNGLRLDELLTSEESVLRRRLELPPSSKE